jgi:hypothetical protein
MDLESIEDEEWLQIIKNCKDLVLTSFSFKILLGQLKTKIEVKSDEETLKSAIKELKSYIMKYSKLPNLQVDLNTLFNQSDR